MKANSAVTRRMYRNICRTLK